MATIRTSIIVNDMMSQQFRAMNMAMSTVIDSFHKLQDATGKAVDLSALELAQRELQQVEASYNQIEDEIRQAEEAQEKFNKDINQADNLATKLLGTLGGIVGTYVTLQGTGSLLNLSDEMTNTIARLDLMNDGLQTTEQLQQMIYESAQRTYGSYLDMADLVGKLAMNAGDAFSSNQEAIAFAELLNKQFVIAGTSADEMRNSTIQLVQALGSGVLRGDELNSIFEQAPTIIQAIADYMNEPIGRIRELAAEGEITAQIVKASMFAAADDINAKFESMPLTFGQIWTSFKNEALWAFQPVLQMLNDIANSERFHDFVSSATQNLYIVATVVQHVFNAMSSIGAFIYDNWSIIGPIIMGVGGALIVFASYLALVRIWTLLVAAAQWAWNAAAAANPIVLIIAGIVLLIGLFYAAIAAINHFAGTSINATGIIAGVFATLGAIIFNIIASIWNIIAALAEFLVNVWRHPIYSVKRLFYNLATNVLDQTIAMASGWDKFATSFVNAIIWAVNMAIKAWNAFIDILPDSIASFLGLGKGTEFSYRASITSDLQSIRGALDKWVGETPENYWEAPRMEFKNLANAWNAGYDWGANLFGGFGEDQSQDDPIEAIKDALAGQDALRDAIEKGNKAGRDTAGNTKKLADSVDMATEDLKYLRDLAERETINRYTTGEIKIDVRNENYINDELDIDGIIDRFAEKLEEAVEVVAEGDELYV